MMEAEIVVGCMPTAEECVGRSYSNSEAKGIKRGKKGCDLEAPHSPMADRTRCWGRRSFVGQRTKETSVETPQI